MSNGKGSTQRPSSISEEEFRIKWDNIFKIPAELLKTSGSATEAALRTQERDFKIFLDKMSKP